MPSLLLKRPNQLIFPGGRPGFDPTYLTCRGNWQNVISFVSDGGGYINLLNGAAGTLGGAPTAGIDGYIGPYRLFGGSMDEFTFSITDTILNTIVMAAIVVTPPVLDYTKVMMTSSSINSGWRFYSTISGTLAIVAGAVAVADSTISLSPSTPYFLAASADLNSATFVVKNLATGAIETITKPSTGRTVAGNGSFVIGNDTFNENFNGRIACGMMIGSTETTGYLSERELSEWAQDPWSFWYPQPFDLLDIMSTTTVFVTPGGLQWGGKGWQVPDQSGWGTDNSYTQ